MFIPPSFFLPVGLRNCRLVPPPRFLYSPFLGTYPVSVLTMHPKKTLRIAKFWFPGSNMTSIGLKMCSLASYFWNLWLSENPPPSGAVCVVYSFLESEVLPKRLSDLRSLSGTYSPCTISEICTILPTICPNPRSRGEGGGPTMCPRIHFLGLGRGIIVLRAWIHIQYA